MRSLLFLTLLFLLPGARAEEKIPYGFPVPFDSTVHISLKDGTQGEARLVVHDATRARLEMSSEGKRYALILDQPAGMVWLLIPENKQLVPMAGREDAGLLKAILPSTASPKPGQGSLKKGRAEFSFPKLKPAKVRMTLARSEGGLFVPLLLQEKYSGLKIEWKSFRKLSESDAQALVEIPPGYLDKEGDPPTIEGLLAIILDLFAA